MSITEDLKNVFRRQNNGLVRLIVINVLVFLAVNITVALGNLSGGGLRRIIYEWIALPSGFMEFATHFWTLFTYMFVHEDLGHIFFNMLVLYTMGRIFTEYQGSARLVSLYILGGIAGGILYLALYNLVPATGYSFLVGASAGVTAIMVGIASIVPNYTLMIFLIGPVRLKYVALVLFVLTSIIDLASNTGGKVAHIGGALFGLLYGFRYAAGTKPTEWLAGLMDRKPSGRSSRMKVTYSRKVSDEEYNVSKLQKQQRIDEILDKISRSGYDSLTKEEKELLFKMSNDKK